MNGSANIRSDLKMFQAAKRAATDLLQLDSIDIEDETQVFSHVREVVTEIISLKRYSDIDANELTSYILDEVVADIIRSKNDTVLLSTGSNNHWLKNDYNRIKWNRWESYRNYLTGVKDRELHQVNELDETTDLVLTEMGDPSSNIAFRTNGLVIGNVQSGKTEHFIGLINKSIDAGYGFIIVLSGIHNDLRSQTQMRIDSDVLGYETTIDDVAEEFGRTLIGIGKITNFNTVCLTTRASDGDVNNDSLKNVNLAPTKEVPLVVVVKKNSTVLEALISFIKRVKINTPTLIIDDEADQASIDIKSVKTSSDRNQAKYIPSPINRCIREILSNIRQTSYIGYTATPFANVLINHETNHPIFGEDLFPKDFILALSTNKDYLGPVELFGFKDGEGMPLTRPLATNVNDDINHFSSELKNAIKSFVITIAIRRLRGQIRKHNSMLIHTDRSINSHTDLSKKVSEELESIQKLIVEEDSNIIHEFKEIFLSDYVPTSMSMQIYNKIDKWDTVLKEIKSVLSEKVLDKNNEEQSLIRVMTINGESEDSLDYAKHKERGLNVIAVGGDKLSRGLTLEDLTISYYLRSSKTYDTLMQMGRWFGYKKGFEDLCRIYTTSNLINSYRHIALASQDLKNMLVEMRRNNLKPTQFGLKIRSHSIMFVTSLLKQQDAGEEMEYISFNDSAPQTIVFSDNTTVINSNAKNTNDFIRNLGDVSEAVNANHLWYEVPTEKVIDFLNSFAVPESATIGSPNLWANYINKMHLDHDELKDFTVVLMSTMTKQYPVQIGEIICNQATRSFLTQETGSISIGALRTGSDKKIITETILKNKKQLPSQGILMIYPLVIIDGSKKPISGFEKMIGLSAIFPETKNSQSVTYSTNTVHQNLQN
ncbi:Z1 domain-containing protein [Paenibacillus oryzisoli]|uniref:Z1 domain-containing protein n=1 Tax=Paenibacillus oryzisoli TaxID=1850517 RepID=UPI003D2B8015